MPPVAAQNMSPFEHLGKSRILISIIALIAIAFILVAVFVYLQRGQNVQRPAVVDQRAQEISQALSQLKGAVPASQAEVQAALKQLAASKVKPASPSQINQALSQLKGQ